MARNRSRNQKQVVKPEPAGIEQIEDDIFLLKGAGAVVQFTKGTPRDNLYATTAVNTNDPIKVAKWGADNLQPQRMLALVFGNHLKPQLIYTTRDFLLGSGVGTFQKVIQEVGKKKKKVLEPIIDEEIDDLLERLQSQKLLRGLGFNLEFCHNFFALFTLGVGNKIESIECLDATDVRAQQMVNGRIENYLYHPDWKKAKPEEIKLIPAYDPKNPTKYGQFIYHGRDETPGQPYYDIPPYWGSEKWTKVSNMIPEFHISGLENGYNLKYHIKIPADYFIKYGDQKAQRAAEAALLERMNSMLSGIKNVDKAFVSKFATDGTGKAMAGWSIEPLDNKMSDEAYSKVNDQANIAHTSAHGIDPSLAGIDTGGKFGGSGSEKRISYQLHIALRTPNKRAILLEVFKIANKIEFGDSKKTVILGFEDIDIVTEAEDASGQKPPANLQSEKNAA